jgi:ribonuclease T1
MKSISTALLAVALMLSASFATFSEARNTCSLKQSVTVADLPKQGRDTLSLIDAGGPFPHDRDGITFNNREKILPKEKRGFYREYTVRTPGVKHRGARRIVCGGPQCYYTDDHYKSFKCIAR